MEEITKLPIVLNLLMTKLSIGLAINIFDQSHLPHDDKPIQLEVHRQIQNVIPRRIYDCLGHILTSLTCLTRPRKHFRLLPLASSEFVNSSIVNNPLKLSGARVVFLLGHCFGTRIASFFRTPGRKYLLLDNILLRYQILKTTVD